MSHAVDDSGKLARNLRKARKEAQRFPQLGTGTADVRDFSDRIAKEALLGLQSRGLVE